MTRILKIARAQARTKSPSMEMEVRTPQEHQHDVTCGVARKGRVDHAAELGIAVFV